MQGAWGIEPTVITERKVFQYEFDTLDLEDIFDNKTLSEVISALTARYKFLLTNRALDKNFHDIKFNAEYDFDGEGASVKLIGKYKESDQELEQRRKSIIERQGDKEAKELLEYQQLHTKFGDIFGK